MVAGLEAKKNDPRRQEAIASLFHVRDRDKVLDGQEVKERHAGPGGHE